MSFSGLASKTRRWINNQIQKIVRTVKKALSIPGPEESEVPRIWLKQPVAQQPQKKTELQVKKGQVIVVKKVKRHWPWLRNFKEVWLPFCCF